MQVLMSMKKALTSDHEMETIVISTLNQIELALLYNDC
jgi:hypothetical protein